MGKKSYKKSSSLYEVHIFKRVGSLFTKSHLFNTAFVLELTNFRSLSTMGAPFIFFVKLLGKLSKCYNEH